MISIAQPTLALVEGFGLAFSPCILPILPLILASSAVGGRTRPLQIVGGFILSFTAFSLISRQLLAVTGIQQDSVQVIAFSLLFLFGLVMLIPYLEERFSYLTASIAGKAEGLSSGKRASGAGGGLLIGALIGLVWTPCAGPILAVALLQVIQSDTGAEAVLTIASFSIGAGIPMLIIGYCGKSVAGYVRGLAKHTVLVRRTMGVIIVIFSLMGLSGFNLGEWVVSGSEGEVTLSESKSLIEGVASRYAAPSITGITEWINSEPLKLDELKGKVVLVDFWTYSCINCIRTLPHLQSWYQKYKADGLIVIGVHSPEFAFEGNPENVKAAIERLRVSYPVAMDNDFSTWKAYDNHYWPAHYLIDKTGQVVYTHFGEGKYDVTENNIRFLLGLDRAVQADTGHGFVTSEQTPETYLGTARASTESEGESGAKLPLHHWSVTGSWHRTTEFVESAEDRAGLTLHYKAKKVFVVMESNDHSAKLVRVVQNGITTTVAVSESRLYEVVANESVIDSTLHLEADRAGVRMFAFTFES